ncbi:Fic family protein [Massilia sp. CCM 8734]|uniref:Fic family protein n=1 Tax=Massilia sp. CCM 8734 TaxID=2609283 RepID=UPI0014235ABE|nr:Fic family protein [Massilia sp. CCM 8734]
MMMMIDSKPYFPQAWTALNATLAARLIGTQKSLEKAFAKRAPGYAELQAYVFRHGHGLVPRDSIRASVATRQGSNYTITAEKIVAQRALASRARDGATIYTLAKRIHTLVLGHAQRQERGNVSIAHSPQLRIGPPARCDPLFGPLKGKRGGPRLFDALNAYLVVISAHPFTDGNGRTARVMLSVLLQSGLDKLAHHIPMAELTRATGGVYEELLARANENGLYGDLMSHLLDLLDDYAALACRPAAPGVESDLRIASRCWAESRHPGAAPKNINALAPYPVSMTSVIDEARTGTINAALAGAIADIGRELGDYGDMTFAMTSLESLLGHEAPSDTVVAFFIKVNRKEELLVRLRHIRQRYRPVTKIQLSMATGDLVLDAKVLVCLAGQHAKGVDGEPRCTVILHDLDQLASKTNP